MDGKLRPLLLGCLLLMTPLLSQALHQGQTPEEVLAELGAPNGKRTLSTGEIWVYSGDITLEFKDGVLIRSKGLDLVPAPTPAPPPLPTPNPPPVPAPELDGRTAADSAGPSADVEAEPDDGDTDQELLKMAENFSDPERAMEEIGWEEPAQSSGVLATVLGWTVPTFLQWIFLLIAFKWVGAEAGKMTLLLIAIVDRLVILGTRWVFIGLLEFPTTFMADSLLSFIVMLGMVTTLTHARQLPTAIKVVVASKVAALIAAYVFVLVVLHNL
jgi:hypothetical protein